MGSRMHADAALLAAHALRADEQAQEYDAQCKHAEDLANEGWTDAVCSVAHACVLLFTTFTSVLAVARNGRSRGCVSVWVRRCAVGASDFLHYPAAGNSVPERSARATVRSPKYGERLLRVTPLEARRQHAKDKKDGWNDSG
jgi:hypothetical protein